MWQLKFQSRYQVDFIKINIWQHKKIKLWIQIQHLRYLQREVCITKNFQQWNSSSTLSLLCISSHDGLYLFKCKLQKILPSISCFCMVFCPNIWIYCIFFFLNLRLITMKERINMSNLNSCLTWGTFIQNYFFQVYLYTLFLISFSMQVGVSHYNWKYQLYTTKIPVSKLLSRNDRLHKTIFIMFFNCQSYIKIQKDH